MASGNDSVVLIQRMPPGCRGRLLKVALKNDNFGLFWNTNAAEGVGLREITQPD